MFPNQILRYRYYPLVVLQILNADDCQLEQLPQQTTASIRIFQSLSPETFSLRLTPSETFIMKRFFYEAVHFFRYGLAHRQLGLVTLGDKSV